MIPPWIVDKVIAYRKLIVLTLLCIQNSTFLLALGYSRKVLKQAYLPSTMLLYTEVVKLVVSLAFSKGQNLRKVIANSFYLLPTALIYYVQNFLTYYALNHLDSATYSVLVQLKIMTSAIFFVALLGQRLAFSQWQSLILLVCGVIMVQMHSSSQSTDDHETTMKGIIAGLGVSCCSGLAGVYFEFVLKRANTENYSVFQRNIQLALWSIVFAFAHMLPDANLLLEKGFFHGYTILTHAICIYSGLGGILVGLVVKYADSVVKNFANAFGMVITSVSSIYLFHKEMTLIHWLGTVVVSISLFNYTESTQNKITKKDIDANSKPLANVQVIVEKHPSSV